MSYYPPTSPLTCRAWRATCGGHLPDGAGRGDTGQLTRPRRCNVASGPPPFPQGRGALSRLNPPHTHHRPVGPALRPLTPTTTNTGGQKRTQAATTGDPSTTHTAAPQATRRYLRPAAYVTPPDANRGYVTATPTAHGYAAAPPSDPSPAPAPRSTGSSASDYRHSSHWTSS